MEKQKVCPLCDAVSAVMRGEGETAKFYRVNQDGSLGERLSYLQYIRVKYHPSCAEDRQREHRLRFQATHKRGKKELINHYAELSSHMDAESRKAREFLAEMTEFQQLADEMRDALKQLRERGLID